MGESIPIVFLDTNLAKKLLKGEFGNEHANLCEELQALLTPPFCTRTTAPSLMELLGVTRQHLVQTAGFLQNNKFAEAGDAYQHLRRQFDEATLRDLLGEKKREQEQYNHPNFYSLWLSLIADCFINVENTAAWIAVSLAVDDMQSVELLSDGDYRRSLISEMMIDGQRIIQNYSVMRLVGHEWNRYVNGYKKTLSKECRDIMKSIKLKSNQDYADCDLVHMAVNGYVDQANERKQVICATCDPPETIRSRIQIYKGYMSYVKSIPGSGLPADYGISHNGTVHCFCLDTGKLVQIIDVKKDTPAFEFIV